MSGRRVVVTGLGLVTPVGNTVADSWDALRKGQSGVRAIEHFDASAFPVRICASVQNFDAEPYMSVKEARKMDLFMQYGVAAGMQAVAQSGLEDASLDVERVGVAFGSGIGGLPWIEKNHTLLEQGGARKVSPFFVPGSIINLIAGHLSIRYGYQGPNIAVVTACTTGAHNIGLAARMIRHGDADVMIAGGAEMASCPLGLAGFAAARALSTRNDDPAAASRPWDRDRDGFVLGDGAGALVLEELEHARARGANILAEVSGFGMSGDAHHITSPLQDGRGAAAAMRNALRDANLAPAQIQYINAHGTSTPAGDPAEIQAVRSVFGEHADALAMSSTKSMIGHLLGAAGAVEAVVTILAIANQLAPPTINLENPDEGCDIDLVPGAAREMPIQHAVSNSFGFGGTNGTLILSRVD